MHTLVFPLSCFVNNFYLILCTLIGLLSYAIHKHSSRSQHISVLTACTFMFRKVWIIEPSSFNTTSGMHRHPFEGRQLFFYDAFFFFLRKLKILVIFKKVSQVAILKVEHCVFFTLGSLFIPLKDRVNYFLNI